MVAGRNSYRLTIGSSKKSEHLEMKGRTLSHKYYERKFKMSVTERFNGNQTKIRFKTTEFNQNHFRGFHFIK